MAGVEVTEEVLPVCGTTTSVLKCGEITTANKVLVLIIPGNPGVALYYSEFMKVLHTESSQKLPVWCVSHAGHGTVPNFTTTDGDEDIFGLKGQIRHKISFVKEHIPEGTHLILIGHSIGCYIILHMLTELPESSVLKGLHLFPTIERMALSAKGRTATPLLKYLHWVAALPMYPVNLIPTSLKGGILRWYFKGRNVPDTAVEATLRIANPFSIANVTYMANQEMQNVLEADHDIIDQNINKLMFYYGSRDHWCPVEYYEDMKARYPKGDVRLCKAGHEHAFVLESSARMAEYLWKWIQSNVKEISEGS